MHRWKFSALATAAALSVGLFASDASALALGRVNVQSALGEPLRAEIELPQITPAEAESLRVAPASPEVFRAQGMEYSPTAHGVQVQLHRRPDGSMVLRLSSSRPINDPFVDLVIDAAWNSGHIVRSYTMLFDPPATRRPQAEVTVPAQVAATPRPEAAPAQPAPRAPAAVAPPAPRPAPAPVRAPAAESTAGSNSVAVRPGDTAGRIADAHRPASVSLDQMLVAMTRTNPDAFVQGNVNRLRAGTVLQIPSEAEAQATPAPEARRIVAAQSRDFNEFRRRLAGAAPKAEVAAAERSARGTFQAQVDDKKPAATGPDKLTLSKGSVQASQAEEQVAREKQAAQDKARMAELSKNISELSQLSGASAQAGAGTPAGTTAGPEVAAPAPAETPASAAPAQSAASAEAPAAAASAPAEAKADTASAPAPAPAAAPQPAPYEAPSFLDTLMEDPLLPGGALALVLALLGYGGYRAMRNRRQSSMDSTFESRLQPDSFFGASGGQRVDTANSDLATGSSSLAYSPSQLDAGGDVDPVAEADVYLAYGRDLQAEEILKEAQRNHPERVSIPAKLAEIYAKRQDRKALEAVAGDVFKLTDGQGPDWTRVADLGRTLDADNPLYQPGGKPAGLPEGLATAAVATGFASTLAAASAPASATPSIGPDSVLPDLDLDLDLDLHEAPPAPPSPPSAFAAAAAASAAQASQEPAPTPTPAPAAANDDSPLDLDLDGFDLPNASWDAPSASEPPAPAAAPVMLEPSPLDLQDSGLSPLEFEMSQPASDIPASAPAPLEFDLGDMSLDLGTPSANPPASDEPQQDDDPLSTKLALAEEFMAIGDDEGARALVEEVVAESSGELNARAQRLLGELSS